MTDDSGASLPPAGWYDDPSGSGGKRYWDGTTWGQNPPPPGATGGTQPAAGWSPAPGGVATMPASPEKKRGRGCLTGLAIAAAVVVVIIIIAAIASAGGDDDDSDSASAPQGSAATESKSQDEEVTVSECSAPDAIGAVYAKGEAQNTSSKRSDYVIEVTVETPDGKQIGTGTGLVQNVEPGQTAEWRALTDTDSNSWMDGSVCKVADVERNESL